MIFWPTDTSTYEVSEDGSIVVTECTWNDCNLKNTSLLQPAPKDGKYPITKGWYMADDLHEFGGTLYVRVNAGEIRTVYVRNGVEKIGNQGKLLSNCCQDSGLFRKMCHTKMVIFDLSSLP